MQLALSDESSPGLDDFFIGFCKTCLILIDTITPTVKAHFNDNDQFMDWVKIRRYLNHLECTSKRSKQKTLLRYIDYCRKGWLVLGDVLGYPERAKTKCANPTCSANHQGLVCSQCCAAFYCNIECQKK
jgi:hypothetical protein